MQLTITQRKKLNINILEINIYKYNCKMKNVEETDNIKDTELSNLKKKVKTEKKKTKNKKKKKDEYTESLFEKEEKDDTVDQFTINNKYVLIKMLGSGSFGEIHLAYDKTEKVEKNDKFDKKLYAIKFVNNIC